MKKIIPVLLFLSLFARSPIDITKKYYIDFNGTQTIQTILKNNTLFKKLSNDDASFGFKNSTVWIYI